MSYSQRLTLKRWNFDEKVYCLESKIFLKNKTFKQKFKLKTFSIDSFKFAIFKILSQNYLEEKNISSAFNMMKHLNKNYFAKIY